MARKKPKDPIPPEPEDPIIYDPVDQDLSDALAGLPSEGVVINLFRYPIGKVGGRPAFVAELEPAAFRMHTVLEQYGGGRFFFKAIVDGQVAAKGEFVIEGEPKFVTEYAKERIQEKGVLPPASGGLGDVGVLAQKIDKLIELQSGGMFDRLIDLVRQNQKPINPDDVEDRILERMTRYKELLGGGGSSAVSSEILGLAKELASMMGQGDQPPWMVVLDKFGDKLAPLLEHFAKSQTLVQTGRVPVQTGKPVASVKVSESTEKPTLLPDGVGDLIGLVPHLMTGASKNADPAFYADFVLDQLPPEKLNLLVTFLKGEDCLTQLALYVPPIKFQRDWWTELRKEILSGVELTDAVEAKRKAEQPSTAGSESYPDGSDPL